MAEALLRRAHFSWEKCSNFERRLVLSYLISHHRGLRIDWFQSFTEEFNHLMCTLEKEIPVQLVRRDKCEIVWHFCLHWWSTKQTNKIPNSCSIFLYIEIYVWRYVCKTHASKIVSGDLSTKTGKLDTMLHWGTVGVMQYSRIKTKLWKGQQIWNPCKSTRNLIDLQNLSNGLVLSLFLTAHRPYILFLTPKNTMSSR